MPIIYALIAHNDVVLCESTEHEGNFSEISRKVLTKMHTTIKTGDREAYVFDGHTFNFKGADGLIFMCLADELLGRNLPFGFLDDISQQFIELFPQAKELKTKIETSDKSYAAFQTALQLKMRKYSNIPGGTGGDGEVGLDTIGRIENNLQDVKNVMINNISRVVARAEALGDLERKTDILSSHSEGFRSKSTNLRRHLFWANMKMKLASSLIVAVILYIISGIFCGFDFSSCI